MEKLTQDFKIEYIKGDTYALAIKFKNITEDLKTAYLTVKENPEDTTPLIQKSLGAGISKIDDRAYKNEKTYKFQLNPIDTVNIEPKVQYLYDIQVTVGTVVKTVLHGIFILGSTLTGTSSVTTQSLEVAIDDELETELATVPATDGIEYEQDPVALTKIGDMTTLATANKDTVVKAINEVNTKAVNNAEELNKIKDGTTTVPKATNATTAGNVSGTINGQEITSIFEIDGVTVKNATDATNAVNATNALTATNAENATTATNAENAIKRADGTYTGLTQNDYNELSSNIGQIEQKKVIWSGNTSIIDAGSITLNEVVNAGDTIEIVYSFEQPLSRKKERFYMTRFDSSVTTMNFDISYIGSASSSQITLGSVRLYIADGSNTLSGTWFLYKLINGTNITEWAGSTSGFFIIYEISKII